MIKLIAAVGSNGELGKRGNLIWRLKGDLAFFKTQTMGHIVVMGANTFKSLPGKLPNRKHYVLTHGSLKVKDDDDVKIFTSFDELFKEVSKQSKQQDVYIIGGATVYSQFMDYADEIILTEINGKDEAADVYFPTFDKTKFARCVMASNEENGISYTHVKYVKK